MLFPWVEISYFAAIKALILHRKQQHPNVLGISGMIEKTDSNPHPPWVSPFLLRPAATCSTLFFLWAGVHHLTTFLRCWFSSCCRDGGRHPDTTSTEGSKPSRKKWLVRVQISVSQCAPVTYTLLRNVSHPVSRHTHLPTEIVLREGRRGYTPKRKWLFRLFSVHNGGKWLRAAAERRGSNNSVTDSLKLERDQPASVQSETPFFFFLRKITHNAPISHIPR